MKTFCTYAVFLLILAACVPSGKQTELVFESNINTDTSTGPIVYNREKSLQAFGQTVYPYVRTKCIDCHNSATGSQGPIFADENMETAFDAITMSKKVDLVKPELSRIVTKIAEGHQSSYSPSSTVLLEAVREWARLAPPSSDGSGAATTDAKTMPTDLAMAQTEHGTILLQAEQSQWVSEVMDGRFSELQDSAAGEGKYLIFTPADLSPRAARRDLTIDATRFSSCREFSDATDINTPASRAIKIMQDRVHNPSENIKSGTNIVNDGYQPKIASLKYNIIRPDKRLEYASMLMSRDFTNLGTVLLTDGFPVAVNRVVGTKLGGLTGNPVVKTPNIFVLPKFVSHGTVFDSAGNFKTGKELFPVFASNFDESLSSIKDNLSTSEHAPLKQFAFYKDLKDTIAGVYYNGTTPRATASINYGNILNSNVQSLMSRDVNVTFQCPLASCNPDQLKFTMAAAGPVLTQSNALDCYTLSGGLFQQVAANLCAPGNNQYFHLIDLYVHVSVNDPAIAVRSQNISYTSTSPSTHVDLEMYSPTTTVKTFLNDMNRREEQPDYLYISPGSTLALGDVVQNFNATTYNVLRNSNCVSCHGASTPVAGIPQFASSSDMNSYQVIKQYINFGDPAKSFRFSRTGTLAHNCTANNVNDCAGITTALVNSIAAWKVANDQDAQAAGGQEFRSLSRAERLPGRVKYKFKVTESGMYNVWAKIKNISNGMTPTTRVNFRILQGSTPIKYSVGSAGALVNEPCYPWSLTTTVDTWEWTSPGRQNELASIDQRGYVLLNNDLSPKVLPDNRVYFNLSAGDYTLDMIGLTEGMRLDAIGLNKVNEPARQDSRLEFQPDRRAADEKNVADYKRKILRYDLSTLLNLTSGKQAFFEVEVKKEFDGQNYIFRNPRFLTIPRDFNIYVKGIKVLINGRWNYPDATYNNFEAVVGDNKVLTYAPLVSLASGAGDLISFQFDKLSVSQESLSTLYPKGSPPTIITDRRCAHLDFFVRNVKPILKNVRVMLNSEMNSYLASFPGAPRQAAREAQSYNCISCHTQTHPYFKMSTFVNDEEFCREAISRVDFDNFYQSLVIRGINGTGNHPKFVFVERFEKDPVDGNNFKIHNGGSDYQNNRIKSLGDPGSEIASTIVPGPMLTWKYSDIIAHPSYATLSATQKTNAVAKSGMLKRIKRRMIDLNVVNYSWFIPEVHNPLIFRQGNSSDPDNVLSAYDVIIPTGGSIDSNRNRGPLVYDVMGFEDAGLPSTSSLGDRNGVIPLAGSTKTYMVNAQPGFDPATMDYDSNVPGTQTAADMNTNWENLRDYYREVVIEWIRRENNARNQTTP